VDLLISTVNARLDWISYLQVLRPNGVLCLVGTPPGVLQIPAGQLLTGQKAICGSDIGDRATVAEMLAFAAQHRVTPRLEVEHMSAVNAGIERLRKNEVRYRMVFENRA
jgi:uncharacterized zinc-type alcohol dehydrogenase-like protein